MHIKTSKIFVEHTLQSISSLSMTMQEPGKAKHFLTNKTSSMTKNTLGIRKKSGYIVRVRALTLEVQHLHVDSGNWDCGLNIAN